MTINDQLPLTENRGSGIQYAAHATNGHEKRQRIASTAYALAYAACLPALRDVARQHGYALGVHGSMATDLDLMACPWTDEATDGETLINALCACLDAVVVVKPKAGEKPHGRMSWNLLPKRFTDTPRLDLVPWLDVAVLPRQNEVGRGACVEIPT